MVPRLAVSERSIRDLPAEGRRARPDPVPFVLLGFLVLAAAITWPWLIHPGSTLVGPLGGDVSTSIVKWETLARTGTFPFTNGTTTAIDWPSGLATTPGLDLASVLSALPLWLGSLAFGAVATHGLEAVLGYLLTATVTFLFVRRVTRSTGAGLVAGVAYGFFPQMRLVVFAATTYSHMWLFILPLWGFWNLTQVPTRRSARLAGLTLLPAVFWTPYFALHAGVISVSCMIALAVLAPRVGVRRGLLGQVLLVWLPIAAVYVAIGLATSFHDVPSRAAADAYSQSAHPLMFVWPGFSSIWGTSVDSKLVELVPRASAANLYLGVSVLLLGCIGVVDQVRRRASWRVEGSPLLSPVTAATLLALAAVAGCFLCSLPPHVLGGRIPMPDALISAVVPALRAGQRFVMPLMAGVSVLAGLGAYALLRRTPPALRAPLAIGLAAIVVLDLWAHPPGANQVAPTPTPAIHALARAPDAPAVEINARGVYGGLPQRACFMQWTHNKPLFNNCGFGTPPPAQYALASMPMCPFLNTLHARGLRYVIVDLPSPPNVSECFAPGRPLAASTVLASDGSVRVWQLPGAGARHS
jgi:hypothetical protein